jgi:transcriptional regulator GlxA family with amidase domain
LEDLGDRVLPLEDLWGARARPMAARLAALSSDAARWSALEAILLERRARGAALHPATRAALGVLLHARGAARVENLARTVGWSPRQLERRFAREVGTTPKSLARTVRFQSLCAALGGTPGLDGAALAWDCGFADQAHLIREFRRFTGTTPQKVQDEALLLARRFVSPARLAAYFAPPPA